MSGAHVLHVLHLGQTRKYESGLGSWFPRVALPSRVFLTALFVKVDLDAKLNQSCMQTQALRCTMTVSPLFFR